MRTIRVTAEHIERGDGGCYACPIALALPLEGSKP